MRLFWCNKQLIQEQGKCYTATNVVPLPVQRSLKSGYLWQTLETYAAPASRQSGILYQRPGIIELIAESARDAVSTEETPDD